MSDAGDSAVSNRPAGGSAAANDTIDAQAVEAFIERWRDTGGKERANYQLFLTELCALLGLPGPEPATDDPARDGYTFERRVDIGHPDGTVTRGYIDLYRRGHFVLEAKRVSEAPETSRWDKAMLRAANQADTYIRALPAEDGRPPFLLTCDVGKTIEVYAEFTRSGGTYVPFPDPRSHRIHLDDLRQPAIRDRLIAIWTEPDRLDPSRHAARVTRELSVTLARLARALEADGYAVERVAHFIKRCLFTMFAEDVDLLPRGRFTALLEKMKSTPQHFAQAITSLWQTMDSGGYSPILNEELLRFNGNLFRDLNPIPLDRDQIQLLIDAARHDWSQVEPAIFGTLLERALDPDERHKLGAHYTPRAYVERLVMPTVIDPLREQWRVVQAAAAALEAQGKADQAIAEIRAFHRELCELRILDPACGSANFLYVTLEHMKRLEGEVLGTLGDLGAGQNLLEMQGNTVDPHQFLGIEINPRAAAIAEMVLWIGYLQWHFRTHGHINPPQPVLRAFDNIECRDAVLAYDRWEYKMDDSGRPVMRWDGKTFKKSPTTGEDIPDESAQVPVEVYINPRKAEWPEADYIVGNPPFIGAKLMRSALGDGYVDALQQAWPEIPQATDYVLRWWHVAAKLLQGGRLSRFGFICSNSIKQTYNRRAIVPFLEDPKAPISLIFSIPDHPWVDSSDGAAVRICMTVCDIGKSPGVLQTVVTEERSQDSPDAGRMLTFRRSEGVIHSNLQIGADINGAVPLEANSGICAVGFKTIGAGFQIKDKEAKKLGIGSVSGLTEHIKPYINGRDLAGTRRGIYLIDFFGLNEGDVRAKFPNAYQHLLEHVKPERILNRNSIFREKWWVIGHPRPIFRRFTAGLDRFIATIETSKHRFFVFLETSDAADSTIVTIGLSNARAMGILSSRAHVEWALRVGGRLGMGNDPRYNKTRCFETFPFPDPDEATAKRIADLAEQLDAHRKRQQARHPGLTITGMYNVLERLRRQAAPGADEPPLSPKEKDIHEQGLVSVLRELHDELDRAVFAAYGWDDLAEQLVGRPGATTPWPEKPEDQQAAEEELLTRLVALNYQRATEEAAGHIRWLRPDYQAPSDQTTADHAPEQTRLDNGDDDQAPQPVTGPTAKLPWPKTLQDQIRAVRSQLQHGPTDLPTLAARFKRKPEKPLTEVLTALEDLGMVSHEAGVYRLREN